MADPDVSSVMVRDELESQIERDLLGPRDGPDEELPPGVQPAERYILGRLVPAEPQPESSTAEDNDGEDAAATVEPELVDAEAGAAGDSREPDADPVATVRSRSWSASSIGMSFQVPASVDAVRVSTSWGRYERRPSEYHETEQGHPRMVWRRFPCHEPVDVDCSRDHEGEEPVSGDHEGVRLRTLVRHRGPIRVVDVAIVNRQPASSSSPDTARLYQVELEVTALDGSSPIFVGHNDPDVHELSTDRDAELRSLELLYRETREFAHGRQCAVDAEVRDGERRAWRLTTTSFPDADVPLVVPGNVADMPGLLLDMAALGNAQLSSDVLVAGLRPLVDGYRTWLRGQWGRVDEPEIARFGSAAEDALTTADGIADRLERAVELLGTDALCREAFRFANQAMASQRVRSEMVRERLADQTLSADDLLRELDVPKQRSWRPFQLAFVLLCLPGLTDPSHRDAQRGPDDAAAQLLFFPTGGGKTEGYLGLTAFTLAIRRLQGVVGEGDEARDGSSGVAVLMRYTLRLLTAQQFQRAAALICACEQLRQERVKGHDGRWGDTPFRLGLWVGSSVTPNSFTDAKTEIEEKNGQAGGTGGVLQLVACPWCGLALSVSRDVKTNQARRRVLTHCPDPEGTCPFSEKQSPREGLPVLTVDEEIYRLTPSLVIATVDKFAQLPWKAATATLFGQVDARCERHGWRNPDFHGFCKSKHPAAGAEPATTIQPAMRLRPPDLVIQDELHLISDALGSMVGLYETVIDDLCTRRQAGQVIRPVLVASTATTRRAAAQVEEVFARGLTVFPPRVIDAGETFFSTTTTPSAETPARRYRGICAPGETLKAIEIRLMSTVMEHAQTLFDRHGSAADPYMTVVDYFTSTRELAGMNRLVEDDVAERLSSQRVQTKRRRPLVGELTSRMPSARIAGTLADLERQFRPENDSTTGILRLREGRKKRKDLEFPPRPIDVLLATSMLQVGVDVPRLGLMIVTGQPKNTAEYIQATSRVGRLPSKPGLVLTILQWSRPRDLGHYERFAYNHATFGMRVEGVTTTPFSDRALDRALSAAVVAGVRQRGPSSLPNPAAHDVTLGGPAGKALVELLGRRAEKVLHDQPAADLVRQKAQYRLDEWDKSRKKLTNERQGYRVGVDLAGLLVEPSDKPWELWTAPMSMREVENEVLLQVRRDDTSLQETHPWVYTAEVDT